MQWDSIIKYSSSVTAAETCHAGIYMKDDKIVDITTEDLGDDAFQTTDARGKYVLPGFIDTHVHSRDGRYGAHKRRTSSIPPWLPPRVA